MTGVQRHLEIAAGDCQGIRCRLPADGNRALAEADLGASRIRVEPELAEISGSGMPVMRWQDSFDDVVEDVFRVQGEIATARGGGSERQAGRAGAAATAPSRRETWPAYDATICAAEALFASGAVDPEIPGRCSRAVQSRPCNWSPRVCAGLGPSFLTVRSCTTTSGRTRPWLGRRREAAERALQRSPGLPAALSAMSGYFTHGGKGRWSRPRAKRQGPGRESQQR